jgi:protein-tyrosine-phosphatase
VRAGEADPFAATVMEELGIDLSRHKPMTLEELDDTSFDLIVTLAPEAHHKALDLARNYAVEVEYWPTPDPTLTTGNREQILEAYRAVRDRLFVKIKTRFPLTGAPTV